MQQQQVFDGTSPSRAPLRLPSSPSVRHPLDALDQAELLDACTAVKRYYEEAVGAALGASKPPLRFNSVALVVSTPGWVHSAEQCATDSKQARECV